MNIGKREQYVLFSDYLHGLTVMANSEEIDKKYIEIQAGRANIDPKWKSQIFQAYIGIIQHFLLKVRGEHHRPNNTREEN